MAKVGELVIVIDTITLERDENGIIVPEQRAKLLTLLGEPLVSVKLRCRVGFHRWGAWGKPLPNSYTHQLRNCLDCNRASYI